MIAKWAGLRIGDRVTNRDGASGAVVGRVPDSNGCMFVEVDYDEPQPRINYAGQPYETSCELIHVLMLSRIGGLW